LQLTNAPLSIRKLFCDALINRLGYQNLSRTGGTLETGGKIHYRTYGSKIPARLSHITDCSIPGVDADTDRQLAFAFPHRAERGTPFLQGESRKHGILHMVVAFDRKVENGEDS